MSLDKIYLYTDGSSSRDKFGGYAYCITTGEEADAQIIAATGEGVQNTTNNRMELRSVIEGLRTCTERLSYCPKNIKVISDSAYVVNCFLDKWYRGWIDNGWCGSSGPILNLDLWKELLYLVNDLLGKGYLIEWTHVRGHNGNHWNNHCDVLAKAARKKLQQEVGLKK